jgi:hypothetical protein
MFQQPTLDQLLKVAQQLTGQKGLFVPVGPMSSTSGKYVDGPHFLIAATIYEGQAARAAQVLWDEVQAHDTALLLTDFVGINLLHSKESFGGQVHELLERQCLTDEQRREVLKPDPSGLVNRVQLFQQLGVLIAMKAIMSCVPPATGDKPRPTWLSIGNLAMAANVFVTGKEYREGQGTSEDNRLMMEQLASWEISNSRDLAYSFGRAQIILQKYLRSTDTEVVNAREALSLDPEHVLVADIPLDEYIALVTAFYSVLNVIKPAELVDGTKSFRIHVEEFLSHTKIPREHFDLFIKNRARTIEQFRQHLAGAGLCNAGDLEKTLSADAFIADFRAFRQTPFVFVDEKVIIPLDIKFISELLAVGVYWSLFDSFPSNRRGRFAQLWGRMFHLYCADLMCFNYPAGPMSPLQFEVPFKEGAADALLDFGNDVVVFEFKGSLLTHAAKAERSFAEFEKDFRKKFVETDDGDRKGISQLAEAALAIDEQRLRTAMRPKPIAIYPVLVCYEAAVESFWLNKYADGIFRAIVGDRKNIRPLTIMSIQELESLLPHMIRDGLTWPEILSRRFHKDTVWPISVHQAVYEWSKDKRLEPSRNDFLLAAYKETFDKSLAYMKNDKTVASEEESGPTTA